MASNSFIGFEAHNYRMKAYSRQCDSQLGDITLKLMILVPPQIPQQYAKCWFNAKGN